MRMRLKWRGWRLDLPVSVGVILTPSSNGGSSDVPNVTLRLRSIQASGAT